MQSSCYSYMKSRESEPYGILRKAKRPIHKHSIPVRRQVNVIECSYLPAACCCLYELLLLFPIHKHEQAFHDRRMGNVIECCYLRERSERLSHYSSLSHILFPLSHSVISLVLSYGDEYLRYLRSIHDS